MFHRVLTLSGVLIFCVGCGAHAPRKESPRSALTEVKAEPSTPVALGQVDARNPCGQNDMVHRGAVRYEGPLDRTKGAQLTINSAEHGWAILDVPAALKNKTWGTQRVRVSGDLCSYACPPMAQCLSTGTIPFVKNVELDVLADE